jgi:hypothetical protein
MRASAEGVGQNASSSYSSCLYKNLNLEDGNHVPPQNLHPPIGIRGVTSHSSAIPYYTRTHIEEDFKIPLTARDIVKSSAVFHPIYFKKSLEEELVFQLIHSGIRVGTGIAVAVAVAVAVTAAEKK